MTTEVQWRLVSQAGTEFPLPQTMIFLGREECDVTLQSRSVDKRHAVITYDHYEKRFKVKDLNSVNGTYVNDTRIPEQSYVKLEHLDNLRFGYDPTVYSIHSSLHSAQQVSPDPGMATLDSHLPNWTGREYPVPNNVAECQGCLHEQAIQHTCGGMRELNNAKSTSSYTKSATVTTNTIIHGGSSGTTSPSLTDYCGNTVHLNAGGGMVSFHSGAAANTCLTTTTTSSSSSSSYSHQYSHHQQQSAGNTPFHNVILPSGASGQGLQQPAHPSVASTTYGQPGGASSSASGVGAFTAAAAAAEGGASPVVARHHPSSASAIIEGRVQALAVSNLASAKLKPESTSSNNSLYSAFSGDSLDQLTGDSLLQEQGVGDQPKPRSSKAGFVSKGNAGDVSPEDATVLGKSSKKSSHRAKKESNGSLGDYRADSPSNILSQTLPSQEKQSQLTAQSAPTSPDESKAKQKGLVTAFTIDFDDVKKTPSSKKLDIKDSISKFAPPKAESERPTHRRNHSLGKVETSKEDKVRPETISPEQTSEKGFYSPKRVSGLRRGYHSEGYFSSDQDDDLSARSELGGHRSKRSERDQMKNGTIVQQVSNVVEKNQPNRKGDGGTLNSSAAFLIDKMFSANVKAPPPSPKKHVEVVKKSSEMSIKSTSTSSARTAERMPSPPSNLGSAVRPSVLNVNSSFAPSVEATIALIKSSSRNGVNNNSRNVSDDDDAKDNVSESGTYTIDKESPSLELQEARRNIDKVFGITPEEPEEAVITGPRGIAQEMMDSPASSSSNSKSDSKRGTPTWLREWAATSIVQSQHSPSPDREGSRQSPVTTIAINHKGMREVVTITQGQAPPPSPMGSSNGLVTVKFPVGEGQPRPRRKLPTPPVDKPPFSLVSSRTSDISDVDVSGRDRNSSPSASEKLGVRSVCAQSPTDNAYDTEKLLRDTENVVYAMEARMDQRSRTFAHGMGSSVESSRDSGGESDVDTSTASYCNESKTHKQDKNVSKRLASQLKSKYQLMDESGHHAPRLSQPAAPSPSASSSRLGSRSRSLTIENETAANNSDNVSEYETASVASDVSSSSDISGSSPRTRRKNVDKAAPALKFNRAFSLRRARLGYLSDGPSEKPKTTHSASSHPPPVPKGKSVESKRSRPTTSASSAGTSLSRNDGGRFSLRVAKNAKGGAPSSSAKTDSSESAAKTKPRPNSGMTASRSNSTLSSKEAELKNWRRRKEYDPMKAAAEGRRKDVAKRTNQQRPGRTPTPPNNNNNFQRSASFHGTEGLHRFRRNTFTSEDDVARSLEDEEELAISASNSSVHLDSDLPSELSEISLVPVNSQVSDISCRVTSEEFVLEDRPAPIGRSGPTNVSHRHKNKLEALDNLVITTIHQLSSKLCNHTQSVLRRLREQYQGNIDKSQSLEDLMELLGLPDTPTSPSTRSMSRDLSGTLKNLKKLEKCIQVIERVVSADSEIPTDCTVQECTVINGKASTRQKCNGLPDGEYF